MGAGDEDAGSPPAGPPGWRSGTDRFGAWFGHPDPRGGRFRLLAGGSYRIGLSDEELAAARRLTADPNLTVEELRPVREVALAPVLVGELPVTHRQAGLLGVTADEAPGDQPALLTRPEAVAAAAALGCRLPTEHEWEAACRGGSPSLFPWGATLPGDGALDRWLSWSLDDPDLPRNPYGLAGLFFGEWCLDEWRRSHEPGAPAEPGVFVVKGGGARFRPWQDEEWVWCMPAMRMPSTDLFEDGRAAVRLVFPQPVSRSVPPGPAS